jgi:hypothetical protein
MTFDFAVDFSCTRVSRMKKEVDDARQTSDSILTALSKVDSSLNANDSLARVAKEV